MLKRAGFDFLQRSIQLIDSGLQLKNSLVEFHLPLQQVIDLLELLFLFLLDISPDDSDYALP